MLSWWWLQCVFDGTAAYFDDNGDDNDDYDDHYD